MLEVEADLITRLTARADLPARTPRWVENVVARMGLDHDQQRVVAALAGDGQLLVIEGAAGAGKTTTLAAASKLLEGNDRRLVVVTPTLKAARVAGRQVGTDAQSAAWLVHQHGYRWDEDGHRWRAATKPVLAAHLLPGDVLLVDEAGMLDQDTARALLTIADETGARIAFVGDRHQLPAVGRGGVLDHAARWARPEALLELDSVHRFSDPAYAELSLLMRTGQQPGEVFDDLLARGQIVVHRSEVERLAALSTADGLIVADTREQVSALNAAIRDHRLAPAVTPGLTPGLTAEVATKAGERVGVGDRIATRRNDRNLGVANRDTWTITALDTDGGLTVAGRNGQRSLPAAYVHEHVELAYATTIHGAQGETVDQAHLLLGETTGAAATYVGHDPRPPPQHRPPGRRDPRGCARALDRDLRPGPGRPRTPARRPDRGRGHRPLRTHRPAPAPRAPTSRCAASRPDALLHAAPGPVTRDRHVSCPLAPLLALDRSAPCQGT